MFISLRMARSDMKHGHAEIDYKQNVREMENAPCTSQ